MFVCVIPNIIQRKVKIEKSLMIIWPIVSSTFYTSIAEREIHK